MQCYEIFLTLMLIDVKVRIHVIFSWEMQCVREQKSLISREHTNQAINWVNTGPVIPGISHFSLQCWLVPFEHHRARGAKAFFFLNGVSCRFFIIASVYVSEVITGSLKWLVMCSRRWAILWSPYIYENINPYKYNFKGKLTYFVIFVIHS